VCLLLIAMTLGATAGFLRVRSLLLSAMSSNLGAYAAQLLEQDERLSTNMDATLRAANASPYPACSEQDIALLRNLLFHSAYVKDVGRIRDGSLLCSAIEGPGSPRWLGTPDLITDNGYKIFYDSPLNIAQGSRAEIVWSGQTDVILSPDIFAGFDRPPMLFSNTIVDHSGREVLRTNSTSPLHRSPDVAKAGKPVREKGMLYFTACSKRLPDCVMTAVAIDEVLKAQSSVIVGACLTGTFVAIALSSTVLFFTNRRQSMANQLRRAVRDEQLSLVYQPIIDLDSGAIVGCEALTRWPGEEGVTVRPDLFTGIAEDRGFIGEITRFVIERALNELGDLLRTRPEFHVTINITATDLRDREFLPTLNRLMTARGIAASSVGLEVTERSTVHHEHMVEAIRLLRDRGHSVYIDDFGTGYSSLAYLHDLKVDFLKIDRVFTTSIGTNSLMASILPQILLLAKGLELRIVVEGIELQEQADYLASKRCGIQAQGWLFGKPMIAEDLLLLLQEQESVVEV